jgi:methylamine---glutamate N-methyltransferase subunit C
VPLAGTTYIPGQTEERALAEIKALLEKNVDNGAGGGRNG